jgi:hypothetical protein
MLLIDVFTVGEELGQASLLVSRSFANQIGEVILGLYPDATARRGYDARIVANGLFGSTLYVTIDWALRGFKEPLERILDHCYLFYEALITEMNRA